MSHAFLARSTRARIVSRDTIEALVARSDAVIVARINSVDTVVEGRVIVTLDVDELLKGEDLRQYIFGADQEMKVLANDWKARKAKLLVFLAKSQRRSNSGEFQNGFKYVLESNGNPPTIVELIDRAAGWECKVTESYMFTMDYKTGEFTEMLKAGDVAAAARSYAKANASVSDESYQMPISQDAIHARIFEGSSCSLVIPVDEALRKLAVQWATSLIDGRRILAAGMLGHIRTDESIAILKTLLKDNAHIAGGGVKGGRYVVERVYEARWAAWNALTRWGVKVERPILFEIESDEPWPREK